jgi:hypothetical protein
VLADLLEAFPGSRLKPEPGAVTGVIAHEGVFHPVRVRLQPFTELFVALAPTEDFELRIAWGDRWLGDTDIGDQRIDDAFFIRTNDPALARRWLDVAARATLTSVVDGMDADPRPSIATYIEHFATRTIESEPLPPGKRAPWVLEVRRGELVSSSGGNLSGAKPLINTVEIACRIAAAPTRWAAELAGAAKLTGLDVDHVASRISLGERALVLEHARVHIELSYTRQGPGNGLVTVLRAARVTSGPVEKPRIKDLFPDAAHRPAGLALDETMATAWYADALVNPETIAIAARVLASLVTDTPDAVGPYR